MAIAFNKVKYTGWLGLDDQLTFGKHQGYSVSEILKDKPEYICWLIDNTDIKFYQSVHERVNKLFPFIEEQLVPIEEQLVPVDVRYWQEVNHWDEDVPF